MISELIITSKEEIIKFRLQRQEEYKQDIELKEFEDHRHNVHLLLLQQRAEKDVRDALKAQEINNIQKEQQIIKELELEKARQHALEMQKLIDEYHKRKEIEKYNESERIKLEKQEYENQLKQQIEENRNKVEARTELYWQKIELSKLKEEELKQKEIKRLELLTKIAEQCPYWDEIQNVDSKLDHITIAALNSMYHKGDELTRGHIPMMGFTDKKIITDTRFKLISALRNAGVAHSDYARVAVANINPIPHLAIHGLL